MGQIYGIPLTGRSPSAPNLPAIKGNEKQIYFGHNSTGRIELLVRLVICNQNPFIQCLESELAIFGQQNVINYSKNDKNSSSRSHHYNVKYFHQFQILFDRCCAISAIEGESLDEIIPDVLDFAYDFKNLPLIFDGAFTITFGKMAQIRPRSAECEHGAEFTVIFHLKDPKDVLNCNGRTANLENLRE